jgi:rod shape-determining protein MreC
LYKQTVRRRRAALALLVAASLTLLTAYFGEPAGGALHALQRGVLQVLAPIQEGAGVALKPVRDLAGWFGDTLHARSERDELLRERDALRQEVISNETALADNQRLRRLLDLDRTGISAYQPVTATVIGRSPTVWYATLTIDRGSVDGVRVDQPVISGDGLVGKVTAVSHGAAQVTLVTDHTSGVSARVVAPRVSDRANGVYGVVQTAVGDPQDLLLNFVSRTSQLSRGDRVVTAGTRSSRLESLFPAGIPIGVVTRVDDAEVAQYQRVHIRPFADLQRLNFVQVLTRPAVTPSARAQSP